MNPFFLPNDGKNAKLIEKTNGLLLTYMLACTNDFPMKSFKHKNKWYYSLGITIPYQANMSNAILTAYYKVKTKVMLDLAQHKKAQLTEKINKLTFVQLALWDRA